MMMSDFIISKDVVVDADNKFSLLGLDFIIPQDNNRYKVFKKYDELEEFENESAMDTVTVKLNKDFQVKFFDENDEEVFGVEIKK